MMIRAINRHRAGKHHAGMEHPLDYMCKAFKVACAFNDHGMFMQDNSSKMRDSFAECCVLVDNP